MTLSSGQSLSSYETLGPPGAGGMGEFSHAKDSCLEREARMLAPLHEGRAR